MTYQTPHHDQARRLQQQQQQQPQPAASAAFASGAASQRAAAPASGTSPSPTSVKTLINPFDPSAARPVVPSISYPTSPKSTQPAAAATSGMIVDKPTHVRTHSFQEFGTGVPRPPPLRTAHSAIGPSISMQRSASDAVDDSAAPSPFRTPGGGQDGLVADDRDELTTKGRKRKRLAKACSACHKNKRRCDGFAPCSNCEFSSRPCLYLNAQGEPIPPPRTRETSAMPQRKDGGSGNGSGGGGGPSGTQTPTNDGGAAGGAWSNGGARRASADEPSPLSNERKMFEHVLESVEHDATLHLELLGIFFRRAPPFSAMFHSPTFYHRLYTGKLSPLLLDVMFAFSARLSDNPALLGCFPADYPPHLRGEPFAERARTAADSLLKARRSWTDEQARLDRGTWEETELVQALSLLSIYYACQRQAQLSLYFLDISIAILRPTSMATLPPPATHLGLDKIEYLTLLETRNRTFWLVLLHDLCAAANGRQRRLGEHEIYNIPLPGPETLWARWGGAASGGRDPGRREGLTPGSGNWKGEEGQIGEIGHVMRVLSIFSDIMTVANGTGGAPHPPQEHEQALKHWALSLPHHLRFDEINLSIAVSKLASPVVEVSVMGWLFAYMHAVAECGMFYLQAAIAQKPGASFAAQRQSQAVDNIAVILDALGERGREGPLFIFPIAVVSNWHDHLRASAASPSSQQIMLGERLAVWWGEMHREWGQERSVVAERGIYSTPQPALAPMPAPTTTSSRTSPGAVSAHRLSHLLEPPSSGLGLYQTGPPQHADSVSSASSLNLPTPSSLRSQHSSLPFISGNRPRAISNVLPTYKARSPSPPLPSASSSSSASRHRHMPSLSSLSDSQGGHIQLPPLNLSPTNRFHPYDDRDRSTNGNGLGGSGRDRDWPRSPKVNGRAWPEPLGIAALVSAAERERERESIPA